MKITIALSKTELTALVVSYYGLNTNPADVILEIKEDDIFTQRDYAMFAEVRQLRSSNLNIAAIKCFRTHTGFGLALSKYACDNLDDYISVSRSYGGFSPQFMGHNSPKSPV